MGCAEYVARIVEMRNTCSNLVGKREGKRPLGRPRRRREDDIKMTLKRTRYEIMDWIRLFQNMD